GACCAVLGRAWRARDGQSVSVRLCFDERCDRGVDGALWRVPDRHMRGTIDPRRGGWVRRRTLRRVRWWAIAMTGIEALTSPPALPRWFGPRASPDDPAVSALIARIANGAGWADIGGGVNLHPPIDPVPPPL